MLQLPKMSALQPLWHLRHGRTLRSESMECRQVLFVALLKACIALQHPSALLLTHRIDQGYQGIGALEEVSSTLPLAARSGDRPAAFEERGRGRDG